LIDFQNTRINTAGAYVCIDDYYLFAIGIQLHNGHIPIFRLGGHREEHETGWQCAVREVYEETHLKIEPLRPPTTYISDCDHIDKDLQEIKWQHKLEPEPIPFLVVAYKREDSGHLSLMYLAEADGHPRPSSEVKGLLLLTSKEIYGLCEESLTLEQYLDRGGRAIFNHKFDTSLVLEPFAQLRLLSKILSIQSRIKYKRVSQKEI
jgi:8-oxo-dGTP pyrophosphatase MutT (NUDIX family)